MMTMAIKKRQVAFYADPDIHEWIQELRDRNPGNKLSAELNRVLRDYLSRLKADEEIEAGLKQIDCDIRDLKESYRGLASNLAMVQQMAELRDQLKDSQIARLQEALQSLGSSHQIKHALAEAAGNAKPTLAIQDIRDALDAARSPAATCTAEQIRDALNKKNEHFKFLAGCAVPRIDMFENGGLFPARKQEPAR